MTDRTNLARNRLAVHRQPRVVLTSFGYGHGEPPEADLTIDARRYLRDPHVTAAFRTLTGLDEAVRKHVLNTPGASATVCAVVAWTVGLVAELQATTGARTITIAVGCVGGRHRSVALIEETAAALRVHDIQAEIHHRDVRQPVIRR
ncbi:RapZ C-terminal domain-containing protein [Streptosporangium canum]|uniref:RapZ C-terminal domain-containing protein n=1 Tax=Streptosporangium canum TaxID=324952 RepID=UPI0037914982